MQESVYIKKEIRRDKAWEKYPLFLFLAYTTLLAAVIYETVLLLRETGYLTDLNLSLCVMAELAVFFLSYIHGYIKRHSSYNTAFLMNDTYPDAPLVLVRLFDTAGTLGMAKKEVLKEEQGRTTETDTEWLRKQVFQRVADLVRYHSNDKEKEKICEYLVMPDPIIVKETKNWFWISYIDVPELGIRTTRKFRNVYGLPIQDSVRVPDTQVAKTVGVQEKPAMPKKAAATNVSDTQDAHAAQDVQTIQPVRSIQTDSQEKTETKKKILLVVDLQRQFRDADGSMYRKCLDYIGRHRNEYDTVIGTIFSTKTGAEADTVDRQFTEELGCKDCIRCMENDLDYFPDTCIIRNTYGIDPEKLPKNASFDLIGCDSDAAISAAAFDLWDKGFRFRILEDMIYSTGGNQTNRAAIVLMKKNFGNRITKNTVFR